MKTTFFHPGGDANTRCLLAALAACSFFVGLDSLITVPLLPSIVASAGLSMQTGVFLVTAYAFAFMLSAPVFGALSDYRGRKRMLTAGVLVLASGTALTGLGSDLASLMLFRAITGIGAGMMQPAIFAMIGDSIPYEKRGRAMGIVTGAMVASTLLGVPAGAFLAQAGNWRVTFWVVAALALLLLVPLRGIHDGDARRAGSLRDVLRSTGSLFRSAFATSTVAYALIATFLWYGGLQGLFANSGLFYSSTFGLDTARIGQVIMIAGIGSFIGSVWGGRLADRIGKKTAITHAGLVTAIAVAALPHIHDSIQAAVGVHIAWAFAFSLGQTSLTALISELRPEFRGTVLSLNSAAMFGGMMVFTAMSSPLLQIGGFPWIGYLCAAATLFAMMIVRARLAEQSAGDALVCESAK